MKNQWCKKAGCGNFRVKNGYCSKHQYMVVEIRKQQDQRECHTAHVNEYDNEWRQVRNAYISEHPLCEDCLAKDKTTPAREIHHILPLDMGGNKTDWNNLVSLCSQCHHDRHKKLIFTKKIIQQINK